jgi:hypothetical protein
VAAGVRAGGAPGRAARAGAAAAAPGAGVRIDPAHLPDQGPRRPVEARAGRSPAQLFTEYLAARGHADEAVAGLFAEYDEVLAEGVTGA